MSDFRYRVIQYTPATGARLGAPLAALSLEVGTPLNDLSTLSASLSDGQTAVTAPAEVGIEVSTDGGLNWTEPPNMRFAIIGDDDNVLTAQSATITAVTMAWQFRKALVFATAGQPLDADGRRAWANVTVGGLMRTLLQEAQARGVLSWLDISTFNSTTDSAGVAWPEVFSTSHEIGVGYDAILNNLADAGLCDWVLQGRSLRLYKVDTFMAPAATGVQLVEGRDFTEAGKKRSLESLAGRNLIRGDGGTELVVVDGAADAPWGAWEVFTTAPGSTDTTSLGLLADLSSARSSKVGVERTYTVYPNATPDCPKPFSDYRLGSTVDVRAGKQLETGMRVRQLTLRAAQGQPTLVTLVLGDRFLERELKAARRLNGLSGGVAGAGGGGSFPSPPADTLAPAAPTSLTSSSAAVQIGNVVYADITVGWTAPTTNTNGTALDDLDHYDVQFSRGASPSGWQASGTVPAGTNSAVINSLFPGQQYTVRVRAVDKSGNASTWLTSGTITTASDSTPPPVPSNPVVTPYLGQLRIYWDGLGTGSVAMPSDFRQIEVHASTASATFTPTAATLVDTLLSAGYSILTDLPYATTTFVRFIAVDSSGNKSAASTGISATTERVTGLDIEALTIATSNMADLAISTAKIADAAIINAKIANLAVDDAKIGSVSVGKLTAGSLTADVTVSARIKTANTGARVELNSSGLQAFNSAGTQTVNIQASDGSATITGAFKTGVAGGGSAYLQMTDSTDRSTIEFREQTGARYAYINSPIGVGGQVGLGMNTGNFDLVTGNLSGGTQGFARLYMNHTYTQLARVEADQDAHGGEIFLTHTSASMRRSAANGVNTGGQVYVDATSVQAALNASGVATGGRLYIDSSGAVLAKMTGGNEGPGGRLKVQTSIAALEMINSSGSGLDGFYIDSAGTHTIGDYPSDIGWSYSGASGWTTMEFRMHRWGGFCQIHIYLERSGANIAAGDITNTSLGTVTSAGNLPSSQTSAISQSDSGVQAMSIDSAGAVSFKALTGAITTGDPMRIDCVYYSG